MTTLTNAGRCQDCQLPLAPFEPNPCFRCAGAAARARLDVLQASPLSPTEYDELVWLCDRQLSPKAMALFARLEGGVSPRGSLPGRDTAG